MTWTGLRIPPIQPLLIMFSDPLDRETFDSWVSCLRQKENPFGLWGEVLPRGTWKVHMYAVDYHIWQRIDIEITRNHVLALLPVGDDGRVGARLLANVKRLAGREVSAFLGDRPYDGPDDDAADPAEAGARD